MTAPRVTIVGLGPAGPEYVTEHTLAEIERVPHRYLRTGRHPSSHLVPDPITFDDVYEAADTFADVYAEITDRLVAAATRHGEVLYAVPGSPLILERTVRALRADDRIECVIHPAMSFLDIAYARLGIDPVEAGVTLVDGHDFAVAAAGHAGPLLVAHTHANWVLSDIKLAVESSTGDEPVVILQRLGSPDELVTHTTWSELDRTVEADHLTCIYIPHLAAPVGAELVRFHQLARTLREQCPWDQEQTHQSLVRYLLEETYEVVDALQALDPDDPTTDEALIEELGDLLYQIEFHATIAEQEGRFTMADVAQGVHDKLVRRHPHVFGPDGVATVVANDTATVLTQLGRDQAAGEEPHVRVRRRAPLAAGTELRGRGAAQGSQGGLRLARRRRRAGPRSTRKSPKSARPSMAATPREVHDELGDLLFAVVNVARHLGVEPESALRAATLKFRARFEHVERLARERGIDTRDCRTAHARRVVGRGRRLADDSASRA